MVLNWMCVTEIAGFSWVYSVFYIAHLNLLCWMRQEENFLLFRGKEEGVDCLNRNGSFKLLILLLVQFINPQRRHHFNQTSCGSALPSELTVGKGVMQYQSPEGLVYKLWCFI